MRMRDHTVKVRVVWHVGVGSMGGSQGQDTGIIYGPFSVHKTIALASYRLNLMARCLHVHVL